MGNRAIVFGKFDWEMSTEMVVGMYVHWYDERDLLKWMRVCKERRYRSPKESPSYGIARLIQVACEDCDNGLNIGVEAIRKDWHPWDDCQLDVGFILIDDWDSEPEYIRSFPDEEDDE